MGVFAIDLSKLFRSFAMRMWLTVLLLVVAACPALGDPPGGAEPAPLRIPVMMFGKGFSVQEVAEDPLDAALFRRLSAPVQLPAGPMPFGELLDLLREQTGAPITVNWAASEISGIDQETVVELGVDRASAAAFLDMSVKQASAMAFDDDKVGWVVRDGIVQVGVLRDLKAETEVRFYGLGPLICSRFRPVGLAFEADAREETLAFHAWRRGQREYPMSDTMLRRVYEEQIRRLQAELDKLNDPDAQGLEHSDPLALGPQNNHGGGLFFADDGPENALDPTYQDYLDMIIEMIQDTVGQPDEWLDEESTIREIDGMLVVKTTRENHRRVEGLLNMLLMNEARDHVGVVRDVQVIELLGRASALQRAGDHAGALPLVEQALLIDPPHTMARAMRQVLRETIARQEAGD